MDVKGILRRYRDGEIGEEEAERMLRLDYLRRIGAEAVFDPARGLRRGVPEVVYARSKTPEMAAEIAAGAGSGLLLFSKASPEHFAAVEKVAPGAVYDPASGIIRIGEYPRPCGRLIGVVTAGTSDVPVAAEAVAMASAMGVECLAFHDVGVAGIHRLVRPLEELERRGADAVVVAAGMEGALPVLVASLSSVPVIGVPVSSGYGHGGDGEAALSTMLQSCVPGLSVVNIDNGIGAGAAAALIALRSAPKG